DTVRSDKNYSTLHDVDNVFFIDGTDNIANALRYKDDNGNYMVFNFGGKWKSNYGEANQIQKHNLFARIHQNKVPFKLLTTTAFSNDLNFENVVQQAYGDYDNYIIMYDDYDVKRCSHELYLLQVVDTLNKFNDNTYLWKQVFKNGIDNSPTRTA